MNIALDYDNTFTRDPLFWVWVVNKGHAGGHKFWIVTSRSPDMKIDFPMDQIDIEDIVYCDFKAKRVVCNERGIPIDVWIDDDPLWINMNFVEEDS